jgi:hypothetical protein
MNTLEQPFYLLRIEALVDGLAVRRICDDQSTYIREYCVRLRISLMNLSFAGSLVEHSDYYITIISYTTTTQST